MLAVDWTSEIVDVLALSLGDGVDENDSTSVEDCRSLGGFPPMLNNLDKVSAGCTAAASWVWLFNFPPSTSADVLTEVAPLPTSECSDGLVVDEVDGRVADVDRTWLSASTVRASVVGLLLDATLGVNGVAIDFVEEVTTKAEVSGLAAIEGTIDEEDIGIGVEV